MHMSRRLLEDRDKTTTRTTHSRQVNQCSGKRDILEHKGGEDQINRRKGQRRSLNIRNMKFKTGNTPKIPGRYRCNVAWVDVDADNTLYRRGNSVEAVAARTTDNS